VLISYLEANSGASTVWKYVVESSKYAHWIGLYLSFHLNWVLGPFVHDRLQNLQTSHFCPCHNPFNRCFRVLATKILGKFSVTGTRTLGRGEVPLLNSGWTFIGSELSSPNYNSSVRAVRSFAIRYLNVVMKPLCGNLDICLTTRLTSTFGRGILFACFSRRSRPKVKGAFLDRAFWSRSCAI